MRRVGTVLAATMLLVGAAHPSASAEWTADQLPSEQELWHHDGASACPEVFFFGLRGSGQNGDRAGAIEFGHQVELLYRSYSSLVHGTALPDTPDGMRVAPVSPPGYAAAPALVWDELLDPFGAYWESVEDGVAATVGTMRRAAARCGSETKFVLAGFSQGAQVVTAALPRVPQDLRHRVVAVLLVASPTWRGDQAITYLGYDVAWSGSLAGSCSGACGGAVKSWAAPVTAALCLQGDAICTGEGFLPVHASYRPDHLGELASWAAERTSVEQAIPTCDGHRATHVGTDAADTVKGTSHDDVIVALGGDDTVTTRGGNDLVCAGDGDDNVTTGSGSDRTWAGRGADAVNAGPGRDWIWGEGGADPMLDGAAGADVIRGGGADDVLLGGVGDDRLVGGRGRDICDGGTGADVVIGCEADP